MELKQFLLSYTDKISKSAEAMCTDKSLVYDTIYLAVIKTKQRYKGLANKERAVEICISLMKQPKKHVKENFSSVEDCIEKALAAKVVPWRRIVSAVAVVLAVAMIVPSVLPDKVRTVDASGFVMEGTTALENLVKDSDVQLKNLHVPEELGAADPRVIADHVYGARGNVFCETVTTANGVTLYFLSYVDTETKKAECIVYEAHTDGWKEAGRFEVNFYVDRYWAEKYDEEEKRYYHEWETYYSVSRVYALADEKGGAFLISHYSNGIQIHYYGANGEVTYLNQLWLSEKTIISSDSGTHGSSNGWGNLFKAVYDQARSSIALYASIDNHYMDDEFRSLVFFTFDTKSNAFSETVTVPENSISPFLMIDSGCYDGKGGWYFTGEAYLGNADNGADEYAVSLIHVKDGQIISTVPLGTSNVLSNDIDLGMLEVIDGQVHLVYYTKNARYYMIYNESGEVVQKRKFYNVSSDKTEYLDFFLHDGELYFLCFINGTYVVLARVPEDGYSVKVGEFLFPAKMDNTGSMFFTDKHLTPSVTGGNIVNMIIPASKDGQLVGVDPNRSTYFFQIVLGESTESEE